MVMNRRFEEHGSDEPLYVISVAARMLGMHAQTLRYYERMGILRPSRSQGRIRLYSQADIARLQHTRQELQSYRDRVLPAVQGEANSNG